MTIYRFSIFQKNSIFLRFYISSLKEGWFFGLVWPEITLLIVSLLKYKLYLSIKWIEFSFDFPLFSYVFVVDLL